jgi:hypothetical protein
VISQKFLRAVHVPKLSLFDEKIGIQFSKKSGFATTVATGKGWRFRGAIVT